MLTDPKLKLVTLPVISVPVVDGKYIKFGCCKKKPFAPATMLYSTIVQLFVSALLQNPLHEERATLLAFTREAVQCTHVGVNDPMAYPTVDPFVGAETMLVTPIWVFVGWAQLMTPPVVLVKNRPVLAGAVGSVYVTSAACVAGACSAIVLASPVSFRLTGLVNVFVPASDCVPVVTTPGKLVLAGSSESAPAERTAPFAFGEAPTAASVKPPAVAQDITPPVVDVSAELATVGAVGRVYVTDPVCVAGACNAVRFASPESRSLRLPVWAWNVIILCPHFTRVRAACRRAPWRLG
jgi:hypothetical protein